MFSGNRRFNGRQGEQIFNQEQYLLYEILKHFLDIPDDYTKGPETGLEKAGALWLDMQSEPGFSKLMYHDIDGNWKPIFDNWFKIIKEIRSNETPLNPREGQLWINDSGVLHYFNGSKFVPIKSAIANSIDFDTNSFQNFLILDSLKMTGGYIIESLSKIIELSGTMQAWKPQHTYNADDLFYYDYGNANEPNVKFYKCLKNYKSSKNFIDDRALIIYEGDEENEISKIQEITLKAQFLIPSEFLDKIFIAGQYAENKEEVVNDNYSVTFERVTDVCIQLSLNVFQGKLVTAVHVNPVALKNIRKRIVKIEKDKTKYNDYAMIKVSPENTEYYGIKGAYGQLLLKNVDYIVKANGIQLITSENDAGTAFNQFDFVYAITYEFEQWLKTKGELIKETTNLNNRTSIWVGELEPDDKLLIFANGLCLEDFYYSYDSDTGFVNFNGYDKDGKVTDNYNKIITPLFEGKTDLAIMRFKKKTNIGVLTQENLENSIVDTGETELYDTYSENGITKYTVTINIPADYVKPLVFIQGPNLEITLQDYEMLNGNKALIKDARPGAAYYIVDAVRPDGYNLFSRSGSIDNSLEILVDDYDLVTNESLPLVFINGFYISHDDLYYKDSRHITIEGLREGQKYVLLKDKRNNDYQLLFDGSLSFTTLPIKEKINDAIVYVGGSLIIDGDSCYTNSSSTEGVINNEVRMIQTDEGASWYYFDSGKTNNSVYNGGGWTKISNNLSVDPTGELTSQLDLASSGYTVENNCINILQNFGNKTCTYYAYRFCNNIENPLIKGYSLDYEDLGNEIFYELQSNHDYTLGTNSLHVWINGVKQEIRETIFTKEYDNGIIRKVKGYAIPKPTDYNGNALLNMPTPYYIIETPETGEYKSCRQEYLDTTINKNTYYTVNSLLSPGIVTVYVDGYRQPKESFIVNDMNTLTFIEPLINDMNNIYKVGDKNNQEKYIEVISRSKVLVEIRQDFSLKETTVQLTEENIEECMKGNTLVITVDTIFNNNK